MWLIEKSTISLYFGAIICHKNWCETLFLDWSFYEDKRMEESKKQICTLVAKLWLIEKMQSHYNFEYLSEMQTNFTRLLWTKVLIFCVEFRELSHLTCGLYQAEKKIDISISLKMVKVVILGEHSCQFVSCSFFFLLSLR